MNSKGIKVNWHFFATSHGKGAVDGVGGSVKRAVFSAIMTRRHHVTNAEEYAECAKKVMKNVTILYVPNEDIQAKKPELDAIWNSVTAVPGTQRVHCVRTIEPGKVSVSRYSQQPGTEHTLLAGRDVQVLAAPAPAVPAAPMPAVPAAPEPARVPAPRRSAAGRGNRVKAADLKPGCHVAVSMDTEKGRSFLYIAAVSAIQRNKVQVKFLRKVGDSGVYKDAEREDLSVEPLKKILFVCPEPSIALAGSRMRYSFEFTDNQKDVMSQYDLQ